MDGFASSISTVISKTLFYLFFSFTLLTSLGQDKSIEVLEDDPDKVASQYYGIDYLGLDFNKHFVMGFGVGVDYFVQNQLWIKANLFRSYFALTDSERAEYDRTDRQNGLVAPIFQKIEIGTTYFFSQKTSRTSKKLLVNETDTGYERSKYILKTELNSTVRFGIRGGYYGYRTSVRPNFTVDTLANGRNITLNGYSSHSLYGGFSISGFQHLVLKSDVWGVKGRSVIYHLYFDAMYGIVGNEFFHAYDESIMRDSNLDYQQDISLNRLGFRVGIERIRRPYSMRKVGLRFAMETGIRPTPQIEALYPNFAPYNLSGFYFSIKGGVYLVRD